MILYKYLSESAGLKVLENNSIGFTQPICFNDPFETQAGYPAQGENPIELMYNEIRSWAKRSTWSENSGVLCFSRNPLNPLMWAHYGDKHRGLVIGIDVEKSGFADEATCLIPAQFGCIIYTQTRPTSEFIGDSFGDPISVGHTQHYPRGHEEKMSRLFLQKPMCWAYEEEVRVVKCISEIDKNGDSPSGRFDVIDIGGRKLFLYKLPSGSIKEIYLGVLHPAYGSSVQLRGYISKLRNIQPIVKIRSCCLAKDTWDIELFDSENAANK